MRVPFYNYSYHGTQLGTVKDKTEIEEAVTQIPESVDSDVSVSVDPGVDVTYTKQLDFSANTDTAETVVDKIANAENLTGDGYAIIVDGKTAALVDSRETADQILNTVKLYYCTEDNDGNKVIDGRIADAAALAAAGVSVTSTRRICHTIRAGWMLCTILYCPLPHRIIRKMRRARRCRRQHRKIRRKHPDLRMRFLPQMPYHRNPQRMRRCQRHRMHRIRIHRNWMPRQTMLRRRRNSPSMLLRLC